MRTRIENAKPAGYDPGHNHPNTGYATEARGRGGIAGRTDRKSRISFILKFPVEEKAVLPRPVVVYTTAPRWPGGRRGLAERHARWTHSAGPLPGRRAREKQTPAPGGPGKAPGASSTCQRRRADGTGGRRARHSSVAQPSCHPALRARLYNRVRGQLRRRAPGREGSRARSLLRRDLPATARVHTHARRRVRSGRSTDYCAERFYTV